MCQQPCEVQAREVCLSPARSGKLPPRQPVVHSGWLTETIAASVSKYSVAGAGPGSRVICALKL